eukprot:Hpha_TRINITY_DN16620_c1_g2::TRINITY_DN16620_c1_g2_i2::g.179108::m.179108
MRILSAVLLMLGVREGCCCFDNHAGLIASWTGRVLGLTDCSQMSTLLECNFPTSVAKHDPRINADALEFCPTTCLMGCGYDPDVEYGAQSPETQDELSNREFDLYINMADKQKMYTQKFTKELILLYLGIDVANTLAELEETKTIFDTAHLQVWKGDAAAGVPMPTTLELWWQFDHVDTLWLSVRRMLEVIIVYKTVSREQLEYMYDMNLPMRYNIDKAVNLAMGQSWRTHYKLTDYLPGVFVSDSAGGGKTINIAGRQRMLSQEMAKDTLFIASGIHEQDCRARLASAIVLFEASHQHLVDGDPSQGIPRPSSAQFLEQQNVVWQVYEGYGTCIRRFLNTDPNDPGYWTQEDVAIVKTESVDLLKETDKAVTLLSTDARRFFVWNFSYTDPSRWGRTFPVCGWQASLQSPINIDTTRVQSTAASFKKHSWLPWRPRGRSEAMDLFNSGQGLRLYGLTTGIVVASSLMPDNYRLDHVQFRTPAEHLVDGLRHPLEAQMVLMPADGSQSQQVTVSIIYKSTVDGPRDPLLGKLLENAEATYDSLRAYPLEPVTMPGLADIVLQKLIVKEGATLYHGSRTTPPCTENVLWLITPTVSTNIADIEQIARIISAQVGADAGGVPPPASSPSFAAGNARLLQNTGERLMEFHSLSGFDYLNL